MVSMAGENSCLKRLNQTERAWHRPGENISEVWKKGQLVVTEEPQIKPINKFQFGITNRIRGRRDCWPKNKPLSYEVQGISGETSRRGHS